MPITSYVCTQPQYRTSSDVYQCSVNSGLRTCETKEGVRPNLLNGDGTTRNGIYVWTNNANPFVVLDIPQGWCVGSVKMTFLVTGGIPTRSLSVHSAERLSTNTSRTMFSTVAHNRLEGGTGTRVVMSLANLTCGRYLRINMTSGRDLYLTEIEVFGTSKCSHRHQEPRWNSRTTASFTTLSSIRFFHLYTIHSHCHSNIVW